MAGHYAGAQIAGDGTNANRLLLRGMASNFAGGWAENSARQWFGVGGKREWSNIAIDAFGNALGNSIAGSYQKEAGENMTAALRERTLATDQEKIQAHYAALGQELRNTRASNDLLLAENDMVPVFTGAMNMKTEDMTNIEINCVYSGTGKFHNMPVVLSYILNHTANAGASSWEEYYKQMDKQLDEFDGFNQAVKELGINGPELILIKKAFIARSLIMEHMLSPGEKGVQVYLTDENAAVVFKECNNEKLGVKDYRDDVFFSAADFVNTFHLNKDALIGRQKLQDGFFETQLYFGYGNESFHVAGKGAFKDNISYFSKDGDKSVDFYSDKKVMVQTMADRGENELPAGSRVSIDGAVHHHEVSYYLFADIAVKSDFWNRSANFKLMPNNSAGS
ncbi:hypothetical protein [Pseudaeromonas paramecii]|uniref:Uncharacterized protein n=1 Tax=Pseudaeromonas paramecii TaxID=2138166 RepID=A0ABP8QLS8_9GAMM